MLELRVTSLKGRPLTAMMTLASPLVLLRNSKHISDAAGGNVNAARERASLLARPLIIVSQLALNPGTPVCAACFSTSLSCSISSIGANNSPGSLVILSSLTSAFAAAVASQSAKPGINPYLKGMHDLPQRMLVRQAHDQNGGAAVVVQACRHSDAAD